MSRYQDIDTSNCTEIWAGTAFYQDCFGQTVCKTYTLYYIQPYIIWVIQPIQRQGVAIVNDFQHDNDTYKKVLVAGYVMAGFFAGFIFIIFLFSLSF